MEIAPLGQWSIQEITASFNLAFTDYFVRFDATPDYLQERWKAAGVDWELSPAAVADNQLVGFMAMAPDLIESQKAIFNVGTGVVPSARGKRLVKKMYQWMFPQLAAQGFTRMGLEVITQNHIAIKAYESVGMRIHRELYCFGGEIDIAGYQSEGEWRLHALPNWERYAHLRLYTPPWEFRDAPLKRQADHLFLEKWVGDNCLSYAAFSSNNNSITQFGFQDEIAGRELFQELAFRLGKLKINNVDTKADIAISVLQDLAFTNPINQYEMWADLPVL
ncbi:MAG: GNAT family N-acetyltransferase [Bacteroidota bacterium]